MGGNERRQANSSRETIRMKSHARVVVVGGGIMGVGLLYHLTKEGWSDVVLVEKGELTSGMTWHAAAFIPHFIGSRGMAIIHRYASELYQRLEAETGQATGFHNCGTLRFAFNQDEVDWYHHAQGMLRSVGTECHIVTPAEIKDLHPLLDAKDIILGLYTPGDGHTDPAGSTHAMAAGARAGGAEIYLRNRVTDIVGRPDGAWDVITEQGSIVAEHVVNAAGYFAPQVGAMVGLKVPVVSIVHHYLVTENLDAVAELDKEPPTVRDSHASCYYRQEQQGLIIGPYEMECGEVWGVDGIDWSSDMELLPPDLDRLETCLERAAERIPAFAEAGIKQVVCGPMTHTPDAGILIGPAAGLRNFWNCCGSSVGITQGPGAGKYLAQWMVHGQTEINVRNMDSRRYGDWAMGDYLVERSLDGYHFMFQVRLPGEYRESGRPVRTTPVFAKLAARGAKFAENFGWEVPKWFVAGGIEERYSYRRTNWFQPVAEECWAVRERVGVMDTSAFAKFEVTGRDSAAYLDHILANHVPKQAGAVVLAHALTEHGGIECEFTVSRLDEGHYYLLAAAAAELHHLDWLMLHADDFEDVVVTDVTDHYGVLTLAGPRSREVLAKLSDADLGNNAFPWLRAREIEVAGIETRALRISYVGELGWELHVPMAKMEALYDAIIDAGEEFGVADFGTYAVNALRLEKAYKAWGQELTTEITPVEAGLERFIKLDKPFIGRDAVARRRIENGIETSLVYLGIDAEDADCIGNEQVFVNGRVVGLTTSGAYGHTVRQSLAFAYVEPVYVKSGANLEVEILGHRRAAKVLGEALYDPQNLRLRS